MLLHAAKHSWLAGCAIVSSKAALKNEEGGSRRAMWWRRFPLLPQRRQGSVLREKAEGDGLSQTGVETSFTQ